MPRRVALVTGGNRGIGRAVVEQLASDGFEIAILDVGKQDEGIRQVLEEKQIPNAYIFSDISNLSTHSSIVDEIFSRFGRLDILVNNAGIGAIARCDFLELLPENYDRIMDINLRGTVFLTQAVIRRMLEQERSFREVIVNVTSVSAEMASPERMDYCMSKAALSSWSKAMALRLAREKISVFEVRPGIIRTDMTAPNAQKFDDLIESGLVPMMRWGEGGDIAQAVSAVASGVLGFATGSVIAIDGGLSIPKL